MVHVSLELRSRLNSIDGVEARVNLASERARVRMPPGTPPAVVIERIESAGFTAQIVDDLAAPPDTAAEADRRVHYLGKRLVVAGLLFMPLSDASIAFWLVPSLRFPGWQWILLALAAPILTWAAWPFYKAAIRNGRHGVATMDTLVSMGIAAAKAGRSTPCSSATRATWPDPFATCWPTSPVERSISMWQQA